MTKGDPERVAKWEGRAAEWTRLAAITADPHVRETCTGMATQAATMATFWSKW